MPPPRGSDHGGDAAHAGHRARRCAGPRRARVGQRDPERLAEDGIHLRGVRFPFARGQGIEALIADPGDIGGAVGAIRQDEPSGRAEGLAGAILFGSQDDRLYCLESDGRLRWSVELGGDVDSSPILAADGTIYVGSDDKKLYALRAP